MSKTRTHEEAIEELRDTIEQLQEINGNLEEMCADKNAEIERLNKNCPLSNMLHEHYVYCHTCEKDIPVTPQRLKGE